jgi:hypothetical protein
MARAVGGRGIRWFAKKVGTPQPAFAHTALLACVTTIHRAQDKRSIGSFVSAIYFASWRRCAFLGLLGAAACTAVVAGNADDQVGPASTSEAAPAPPTGGDVKSPSSAPTAADGRGLPCDVAALLQHYCVGCHSSPPTGGAPNALLSYDAMVAKSTLDATQNVGAMSVTLLANGVMPPKPSPAPSAAEKAALSAWVAAGMPRSSCTVAITGGTAMSPYDTPLKCSSGTTWTRGDSGSAQMHPGGACIACHAQAGGAGGDDEAPRYAIAGTVYPSAHEPNDCNGSSTSAMGALSVLITEANGKTHSLPVNAAGNFFYSGTIATPYTAQITAGSAIRAMTHTQTSGDCNACHTVNGASNTAVIPNAPGRIMAP